MKRTHLYSFVGTSAAVKLYLTKAGPAAPAAAEAASAQLESTAQALLEAAAHDASDDELQELVAARVVDVVEAVEALRSSGVTAGFDATLNALLEYFYGAADAIMGGGGDTSTSGSGYPSLKGSV
jgi:hypothetical protein